MQMVTGDRRFASTGEQTEGALEVHARDLRQPLMKAIADAERTGDVRSLASRLTDAGDGTAMLRVLLRRCAWALVFIVIALPFAYQLSPKPVAGWYFAPALDPRADTIFRFTADGVIRRHARNAGTWTAVDVGSWSWGGDGLALRLENRGSAAYPANFPWPNAEMVCGFGEPLVTGAVTFHRYPSVLAWWLLL